MLSDLGVIFIYCYRKFKFNKVLKDSLYRFFGCLALSAISSGRFGPAVATEASSQVLKRPSPKDLRFALFLLEEWIATLL